MEYVISDKENPTNYPNCVVNYYLKPCILQLSDDAKNVQIV